MPDHRRIQMAWGRTWQKDMPFTQMMLLPTEFRLITTPDGLRMVANPIHEIDRLHAKQHTWNSLTASDVEAKLRPIAPGPLEVKMDVTLPQDGALTLQYQGTDLVTLHAADLPQGHGSVQLLIDKAVTEIFVDGGRRYIVHELPASDSLSVCDGPTFSIAPNEVSTVVCHVSYTSALHKGERCRGTSILRFELG